MSKTNAVANSIARATGTLKGFQAPQASARVIALVTDKARLNARATEIKAELDIINAKLLKRVKDEGAEDPQGKIKLETDDERLQVIAARTSRVDPKILLAQGVSEKVIRKATITTEYEYVGVYPKGGKRE